MIIHLDKELKIIVDQRLTIFYERNECNYYLNNDGKKILDEYFWKIVHKHITNYYYYENVLTNIKLTKFKNNLYFWNLLINSNDYL